MTALPRPRDLSSELADLRKRLEILERTSRLQNASIGSGGLLVRDGGSVTIEEPGDLLLTETDGDIIWRASTDAVQLDGGYTSENALTVPASWSPFGGSSRGVRIDVPDGFDRVQFLMMVSAGQTFSTEGNVSVQPQVTYRGGWENGNTFVGPAINSGNGGNIAVAQSFWAQTWTTADADSVDFGLAAVRAGTPVTGVGNWHVAVNVIFKRR